MKTRYAPFICISLLVVYVPVNIIKNFKGNIVKGYDDDNDYLFGKCIQRLKNKR